MTATPELATLMALRVHGRSDAAQVARAVGADMVAAEAALAAGVARGTIVPVQAVAGGTAPAAPASPAAVGPPRLFALSEDGRARLARLVAGEPIARAALAACYDARFAPADRELKEAVTAWQLAPEPAKTAARPAVLAAAARAGEVATVLAAVAPRLAPYPRRLADAAAAIAAGDARFVASPRVDSVHQAWFALHEDLLVTLGRSRDA